MKRNIDFKEMLQLFLIGLFMVLILFLIIFFTSLSNALGTLNIITILHMSSENVLNALALSFSHGVWTFIGLLPVAVMEIGMLFED